MSMYSGLRQTLVGLLCALAPTCFEINGGAGAEPTEKYFTYEGRAGLAELDQLNVIVASLVKQEQYADCLAITEYGLAIQRAVGDYEREVAVTLGFMAELRKRTKDFTGAWKNREEILDIQTRLLGVDHWKTADARREVGRARRLTRYSNAEWNELKQVSELEGQIIKSIRAGKAGEAVTPAQQLLDISRRLYGADDPDYADKLVLVARVRQGIRKLDEAADLLDGALAIQRRQLGEHHPDIAATLTQLASLHDEQGAPSKSLPLYQLALEIRREAGERNSSLGESLNELAYAYRNAGEFAKAEPLFLESLDVFRGLHGEKNAQYVGVLTNLGSFYRQAGDYSRAHDTLQRARALRREISGERSSSYGVILSELGLLANRTGEYDEAIKFHSQAAAIDKEQLGDKSFRYAIRIANLAASYADAGEFEKAEPLHHEAMAITKSIYGENHPKYAEDLNLLGSLYARVGDYTKAEQVLRQSLSIRQSTLGQRHIATSAVLMDLADVLSQKGDHASAQALLQQSLDIRRAIYGGPHQDIAATLNNLATLYVRREQYDLAKSTYAEAVEVMRAAVGDSNPGNIALLNNLGYVRMILSEYGGARTSFTKGLEIAERSLGFRNEGRLQLEKNLATLYQCTQEYDKAEPLLVAAIDAAREQIELASSLQSERQQLAMRQKSWQYLNAYLDLTQRVSGTAAEAYAHVLRWKGEVGARQLQFRRMRRLAAGGNPNAARLQSELIAATRELSRLVRSTSIQNAKDSATLVELRDQIEKLQTQLAASSADYRQEQAQQHRTAEDIRRSLPDGSVLVDLLTVDRFVPHVEEGARSHWELHLVAFVVRRDQPVERVDLGPVSPIQEQILAWRKQFGVRSTDSDPGAALRSKLWEPLAKLVGDAKVLLISPHAATAPLPWGALPGKTPGKYLIEEFDIAVVPIPGLLPELLADDASNEKPTKAGAPSLLLVGDVDFDAPPQTGIATNVPQAKANHAPPSERHATRGADPLAWKALPGTRDEIAAIKASYRQRYGGTAPNELTQRAATKHAICDAAAKHQYLHFSTHGFFAPATIKSAADANMRERGDMGNQPSTINLAEHHPGLLSGLVLAGANRIPAEGEEDGILTALEVGELDLGNVELATLSACETGLGETAGGEGLLGLQRAFQTAGAKTVVSGLWQVPDKATQVLMTRFYGNLWQKKMSRLAALVAAQRSMLNLPIADREALRGLDLEPDQPRVDASDRLPPFYWAAFVLSGDWR